LTSRDIYTELIVIQLLKDCFFSTGTTWECNMERIQLYSYTCSIED